MSDFIYLDHAAATPLDNVVLEAMMPYFSDKFYNPSSPYSPAVEVKRDYQNAKQRIAQALGVGADELVMTAGATESINLAFSASYQRNLVANIEHQSVVEAAKKLNRTIFVEADHKGFISPELVKRELATGVSMVSIALANHELGTIQPIAEIAEIVKNERERRRLINDKTPLLFHTDASQALSLVDVKPNRLGVDLLTLSASKIYGPKQVGLLWVRPGIKLKPSIVGGGQEAGLRSGTENVAGVIGFAVAVELASKRREGEIRRLKVFRDKLATELLTSCPDMVISSDNKKSLVSYLNVSFPGIDAERLVFKLESKGVLVATGSACSANKGNQSTVLRAIGLDNQLIDGSLRLTLGRLTSESDVEQASKLIIEAVQQEKARLNGS
ncbi:cysteine desulfurase [Candidatus Saccharibacteria bacterium]|nr:cysteine desulfurase [Candidatus Saccharibacteria bacterium]